MTPDDEKALEKRMVVIRKLIDAEHPLNAQQMKDCRLMLAKMVRNKAIEEGNEVVAQMSLEEIAKVHEVVSSYRPKKPRQDH